MDPKSDRWFCVKRGKDTQRKRENTVKKEAETERGSWRAEECQGLSRATGAD